MTTMILRVTHIGNIRNLVYMSLFIGALLLYNKERISFLWFGMSMGISAFVVPLTLKKTFLRARPTDGLLTRGGYSFPSGHTMGTLALYGLIIILAIIYLKKAWMRHTVILTSLALILLISWSRIHLGVHFFSDIIGSLFLGVALLIIAWLILVYFVEKRQGE